MSATPYAVLVHMFVEPNDSFIITLALDGEAVLIFPWLVLSCESTTKTPLSVCGFTAYNVEELEFKLYTVLPENVAVDL